VDRGFSRLRVVAHGVETAIVRRPKRTPGRAGCVRQAEIPHPNPLHTPTDPVLLRAAPSIPRDEGGNLCTIPGFIGGIRAPSKDYHRPVGDGAGPADEHWRKREQVRYAGSPA
jgi:hypothetical protein